MGRDLSYGLQCVRRYSSPLPTKDTKEGKDGKYKTFLLLLRDLNSLWNLGGIEMKHLHKKVSLYKSEVQLTSESCVEQPKYDDLIKLHLFPWGSSRGFSWVRSSDLMANPAPSGSCWSFWIEPKSPITTVHACHSCGVAFSCSLPRAWL